MLVASFSTRKRLRKRYIDNPFQVFITRRDNPFGKNTVNSKGDEPLDKDGEIRFRSARLDYGCKYNSHVLEQLKEVSKLKFNDKRRKSKWEIEVLEIGHSPFEKKGGRTEKPKMGGCKTKIGWLPKKRSANILSQTNWSSIQSNLTGRIK